MPAFTAGDTVAIGSVVDGRSLRLADGREVVLSGIETPSPGRRGESSLTERARSALVELVGAGSVELRFGESRSDRYDRIVAQLFADGRWVQGELLRRGLARVHGFADARMGLPAMMAIEAEARAAQRGIWATALYAVRPAESVGRDSGSFQLVEGTVAAIDKVEGGVYVNFGADWHTSFSLHIATAVLKLCRAAGLDPATLKGTRLRVRGFVDGTRRPLMEVHFPEQIERL